MSKLIIKNFSCIDDAAIDLTNLTLLIGPQASGKSVVAKLVYFFQNTVSTNFASVVAFAISSEEELEDRIIRVFKRHFPETAWGKKSFSLVFMDGDIKITAKSSASKGVSFTFSKNIKSLYSEMLVLKTKLPSADIFTRLSPEWREAVDRLAKKHLGAGVSRTLTVDQLFIPAGRSFFTNQTQSFDIATQAHLLDPSIIDFGRLFSSMQNYLRSVILNTRNKTSDRDELFWDNLLGGVVQSKEKEVFFESHDGRVMPLTYLSSGQQEMYPLMVALRYARMSRPGQIFIEEPEAHLFPDAQAQLMQFLVGFIAAEKQQSQLFITTHSPYILAQVNNLMEAGRLAKKLGTKAEKKINKIVPKEAWLRPGMVSAYKMEDGRAISLIDKEYGVIDTEYLDAVSQEISSQFNRLMMLDQPDD